MTEVMKKLDIEGRIVTMRADEIASLPREELPPPDLGIVAPPSDAAPVKKPASPKPPNG